MPNFSAALVQISLFWCTLIQRLVGSTLVWVQSSLPAAEGNQGQEQAGASPMSTPWVSVRAWLRWAHPSLPGKKGLGTGEQGKKCHLFICHHRVCWCAASFMAPYIKPPVWGVSANLVPNLVPAALALAGWAVQSCVWAQAWSRIRSPPYALGNPSGRSHSSLLDSALCNSPTSGDGNFPPELQ